MIESKESSICSVLPSVQSFTGCDTTSSFVRRGKILPLRNVEKNPSFLPVWYELGKTINVSETLFRDLGKFVCCMYGKPKYIDVNKMSTIFSLKSIIDDQVSCSVAIMVSI